MGFAFLNRFKKILIAEDDMALQKVLVFKFQSKGFKVVTANSGRDVLTIVAQEKPSAIILDLILPAQDGVKILHELRSPEVDYKKPVVILTNLSGNSALRGEVESLNAQYFNKAGTPIDTAVNALIQQL
jgi:DNA-binding response OmpR family regulator